MGHAARRCAKPLGGYTQARRDCTEGWSIAAFVAKKKLLQPEIRTENGYNYGD
jgi:hypothetical protein